ncbi:MAG TPA: dTMP kinase [Candidatus Tumulicola sp.]
MFVAFEGIEGSGKSTLLAAVAAKLAESNFDALTTREPGGTPLGDAVRALFLARTSTISPMAEAMLVNAARAQHVTDVIVPRLRSGGSVLCDRYVDSTLAYQGYGRGLPLDVLQAVCDAATAEVMPDVTVVLDVPVEISRERARQRGILADRLESEDDAFHLRVRQGFLALAARPGHVLLDGRLPVERLLEQTLSALREATGIDA